VTTKLVIVPDELREAVHAAIDKALNGRPCSGEERESIYGQLLWHYGEHGCIPEFALEEPSP